MGIGIKGFRAEGQCKCIYHAPSQTFQINCGFFSGKKKTNSRRRLHEFVKSPHFLNNTFYFGHSAQQQCDRKAEGVSVRIEGCLVAKSGKKLSKALAKG